MFDKVYLSSQSLGIAAKGKVDLNKKISSGNLKSICFKIKTFKVMPS